jgi:DtxR family Mn-dependent transcriptional regulator
MKQSSVETRELSPAGQDYLKAIFLLVEEERPVTTQALAARLAVAPPSVTNMVKRLAEMGLVSHTPYGGVSLTERGRVAAAEVVRHHRLIELFLAEVLDVPWDRVHEEAERLEHVISEDLEVRMAAKLGEPCRDPHGDPIPGPDLTVEAVADVPVSQLTAGEQAVVVRVPGRDPEVLQYLAGVGLKPGAAIEIEEKTPLGDVVMLRVGTQVVPLGSELARQVLVAASGKTSG